MFPSIRWFCLCTGMFVAAQRIQAGPVADTALQAGQARLNAGDAKGAEKIWRDGLDRDQDAALLDALGGLLFQSQRLAEAEIFYQRLAKEDPHVADAWYQLGLVRAARGHYKDAVDAQRLAVSHAHQFGQAYCALALDLRETGQGAEAMRVVQKAVALMPDYAGAWNLQANLKQDQADYSGAALDYAQALRLAPDYAGAWFNQAQMQEKQRQIQAANESYTRAIAAKPDFAEARLARAELNLDRHALDAAETDFKSVLPLDGWDPEAWWGLSRVAKARREPRERSRCLARYREAVHARDHRVLADRKAGLETVSAYEPGMPLSATLSSH
jgi:tetratricopeptide (TPR) repeat protein